MVLKTFNGKTTTTEGLWWHPDQGAYTSASINLKALKDFKGNVRLVVKKNRFYIEDSNRPKYVFCLRDANAEQESIIKVIQASEVDDGKQ